MNIYSLYKGHKRQITIDQLPHRRSYFKNYLDDTRTTRHLVSIFKYLPFQVKKVIFSLWGLRTVMSIPQITQDECQTIAICKNKNEKKTIKSFPFNLFPKHQLIQIKQLSKWPTLNDIVVVFKISHIIAKYCNLNPLLQLRLLEYLNFYCHYKRNFPQTITHGFTSSETNPHSIAFIYYLRAQGKNVFFLQHGLPLPSAPKISYNGIYFHYELNSEHYLYPNLNQINGYRNYRPSSPIQISELLKVGIALPKSPNWQKLTKLINHLSNDQQVESIGLRIHPHNLRDTPPTLSSYLQEGNAYNFIHEKNLLICGNTSFLTDGIIYGIPSFFYDLDDIPNDYYQLVKLNIIPEISSHRLNELTTIRAEMVKNWEESVIEKIKPHKTISKEDWLLSTLKYEN